MSFFRRKESEEIKQDIEEDIKQEELLKNPVNGFLESSSPDEETPADNTGEEPVLLDSDEEKSPDPDILSSPGPEESSESTIKAAPVAKKRSLFGFFFPKTKTPELYDPKKDGPLVEPKIPKGYTLVEEYWVSEGRSKVLIVNNDDTHLNEYMLFEPVLTRFEYELLERLFEDMRDVLILTDEEIRQEKSLVLIERMSELLREYKITLKKSSLFKLRYYLNRNFLGWSRLDPLIKDPNLEDISCDGSGIPIFLYHRKYRNIKTNISFEEEVLNSLAITLAQRSGKHISISQPMLDATLPDGSRLQLTLGKEVTSRGTSFTIRKFREDPFTPVELMEYGTFSADELAFFWLAIENNKSLLFVGGTASGKTSSLNAVSLFIPPLAKVVSIEDTREITLYHDNWIASVTRESVTETASAKIDMFDLLKAAMRQRPEYILVGEVRGSEAQTLFQAMNTGHTTFSTLHGNDVDAAIHRLENAPLNVPRNMVQALDIVSVQALVYRGQERVRRSLEIVEIAGIDPATGNLRVNNVFEYYPITDVHSYSGRSKVYSGIMEVRGWSSAEMSEEIQRRKEILLAMQKQGIRRYVEVTRVFQAYSINPERVMENIDDLVKVFS
ncbi:type II/IV secretion system ATPase subunit [Methanoplanus sp. FWC-SCC4]|uniref:Type II/IV secretion system ATPase subunit n=1 Tax=Methanochimaera problematica TaxID=2609417 RepID=A0AA97FCI8_9EURY|nr:type II/IV secretion system ATPase subunit [Methanoplanus sp. FWC-SCC4]WOF16975.1 type II/IV secretion system ATPase subunit [Methanoplanus sp. FWC-SCC4]